MAGQLCIGQPSEAIVTLCNFFVRLEQWRTFLPLITYPHVMLQPMITYTACCVLLILNLKRCWKVPKQLYHLLPITYHTRYFLMDLHRQLNQVEKMLKNPKTALSFTPNYLSHPVFPYGSPQAAESSGKYATENLPNNAAPSHEPGFLYQPTHCHVVGSNQHCPTGQIVIPEEIVLKVRTDSHYSTTSDFVEVSLNRKKSVSLSELIALLCQYVEYELSPKEVTRIRKLPNTILKSDDDIRRLTDYQELELVLLPKSS